MSPSGSSNAPKAKARRHIDQALAESRWALQDRDDMNLAAAAAIAIREFKLDKSHGYVDYMLLLDGHPVGVCEAKPAGAALIGVEHQVKRYVQGIPAALAAPYKPLPFAYLSTGEETLFINHFDPHPRTRPVFSFHRPDTLREWLTADTLDAWLRRSDGFYTAADETKPSTLRARLRAMPPVGLPGMWPNKVQAVASVEKSLFDDRPRSLIQMATGSGKTLLAVTTLYRLIKFGGARRVLFLVDRANLGEQAEKQFQGFRTPDDNRLFAELYGVQRLASNTIGSSSKVVISTIQRLYSILKGEPELDPEAEEHSDLDGGPEPKEPMPVVYNAAVPPEFFDVIFIDECHRSIYSLWRQVLEYFDAHLIGLTATPAKHTYGFFNQNVVMEYPHAQAVADGVNCDYEVYRIRTQITAAGATIEAAPGTMVGYRDRQTRKTRWEAPDEDVTYAASDLDRNVVAIDQIRLIVQTFRDKVLQDTFPERTEVPKTLIFAKDDSHAEDIVRIVREEFGKGNEFVQKITYKVTGASPKDLIQAFRNSYYPRVVVTVDLIATGTDIKPVEIVMFMRSLKSRVLFEQMKGRGVRVISTDDLRAVTPDARAKTHFLIVDCVGVSDHPLSDTRPLDKHPTVSLRVLLDHVAANGTYDEYLASLASRISRIDKQCDADDRKKVDEASGGVSLACIAAGLVHAIDDDVQEQAARKMFALPQDVEPSEEQIRKAELVKMKAAGKTPKDNRWKDKYSEPTLDKRELPSLPEGWQWARLDQVSEVQLGQQRAPVHAAASDQLPYVRAANITWEGLDLGDLKTMGFPNPERYRLKIGDVLLSEASGSPMEAGKPAVWRDEIPGACYQKTLLRVRAPETDSLLPAYLRLVFLRDCVTGKFARLAPGVGIVHLTAERMLPWPVPVPPRAEQQRIVDEVERLETVQNSVRAAIARERARIVRLRQAVLTWAFEGRLVEQTPDDEPAEALLGRIRAERANKTPTTSKARRSRKLKAAS